MATVHETETSYQVEFDEFPGLRIEVGRVSFEEKHGTLLFSFHYDVVAGEISAADKINLDKLVGDFIIEDIEEGLESNRLIYTGGTD